MLMSAPAASSSWDLTPAIELLHSFEYKTDYVSDCDHSKSPCHSGSKLYGEDNIRCANSAQELDGVHKLGDFGALFAFLSQTPPALGPEATSILSSQARSQTVDINNTLEHTVTTPLLPDITKSPSSIDHTSNTLPSISRFTTETSSSIDHASNTPRKGTTTKAARGRFIQLSKPAGSDGLDSKPTLQPKTILRRIPPDVVAESPRAAEPPKGVKVVNSRYHIESILIGSVEEKRSKLLSLLIQKHPSGRKLLKDVKILEQPTPHRVSTGIHVFVDMSNIMVGFHECIKMARGIPLANRVRRLPLSFHNFSLVLERGRQTSKRVLVGSDRFQAIDEAEKLGYETNILERVHKIKPVTPSRKVKTFGGGQGKGVNGKLQDQSSSSETNGSAPVERWVEQAVDEILHLKILESIVDTESPSTIVLATGDAASAEYSDGFLKMVERALIKGWMVELVSFRSITSRAYSRKDFRARWGPRFQIIELDVYAEHLLHL
ncbi:hypothetical protein FQN57_006987 [Myotisia sp. PD_48]|nr:hypothetical protein FQN57_006987 [Myotisia sp. PD_48]